MRPPDFPNFLVLPPDLVPFPPPPPPPPRASFGGARKLCNISGRFFPFRGFWREHAFFLTVPRETKQGEEAQGQSRVWGGCAVSEWRSAGRSRRKEGGSIPSSSTFFSRSTSHQNQHDTMSPGRLARPVASRGVMSKNQKKTPGSTVVKSSGCQKTGSSQGPPLGCGKCRYSARGCARCKAKAALAAGGMTIASTARKNQKKKVEPSATKTKASPTAARGKSDGGLGCGKCRFSKRGCARCKARIGEGLIAGTKAQ